MFPVHHQFDLPPHQMNEMQPAPAHYCPSSEAIPPQMRPVPDSSYYQSWPCSSNYAYMHPAQFHGCCQQTQHFPGSYGFRPPHFQQSPHYFHGNCAVYPGPYPTPCIPPFPFPYHNTMELPHYEYDKNTHHCCSCPNNSCNRNSGRNVKIEEADPQSESQVDQSSLVPVKSRNGSDPLVWYLPGSSRIQVGGNANDLQQHEKQEGIPHNAKSQYPYPILWFPSNVSKVNDKPYDPMPEKSGKSNISYPILWFPTAYNNKDGVCNEPKAEKQIGSYPMTPDIPKSQQQQQNFMNGWFPFSTDKLKSGSPREELRQNGADKSGLACPVFWMPYKPDIKEIEESKTNDVDQESARRAPPPSLENLSEMVPANKEEENNERKDESSKEIVKTNKLKTIPVKQADPNKGEKKGECAKSSKIPVNCSDKGELSKDGDKILSEMIPANKEEENNERKDGTSKEIIKSNKLKTIPVKQAEPNEGEKKGECARSSDIPVNCSDKGKLSKDGDKRKSPSPTKSSKLPPVCLRVDPMPRKRTTNGSSRSPSPPGEKEKSNKVSGQDPKPGAMNTKQILQPSSTHSAVEASDKGKEQNKSESRTIQASEGTGSQGGKCELFNNTHHGDKPTVDLPATDVKCKGVVANNGGVEEDKSMHFSNQTPDEKGKSNNVSREDIKAGASANTEQIPQPNLPCSDLALGDNEKQEHKSKLRTIRVSGGTGNEATDSESSNNAPDVVLAYHTGDKPAADLSNTDINCKGIADANRQSAEEDVCCQKTENEDTLNAKENHTIKAKESRRINLTEAEAARIIQSAYRGYAVRKWEPLVKLKQVMEVKMKAGELKGSIEAFESSLDVQGFEKWKIVIGETIMSLLLKLDTIQGVLPSIRDFRRSVAKELVDLQEKVDHITKKKAEIVSLQDSPGEIMDDKADICNKKGQEEEKQGQEDNEAETELVNEFNQGGACQAENDNTPQESITEVTTMETKPHYDDPQLDAVPNSHSQDCQAMPMKVADVSEISLEPISNTTCAETELENDNPASGEMPFSRENNVSEAKDMKEFPIAEIKEDIAMADSLVVPNEQMQERASGDEVLNNSPGVPELTSIKDNYPLKGNQGADEVLAESYIEPKLAQLPQVVNLIDDNCESNVHFEIEDEEKKHKTDEERVDVNVIWADGGVSDANFPAPRQETAPEMESSAEIINDKSELNLENEIPAVTTINTTGTSEEEVEQQQLLFSGSGVNVPAGGGENSAHFINSTNEDEPQECDSSVKLSKSCEEEQPNGKIDQLQASSEGAEGNGIEKILTDKINPPIEELPPTPTSSEISTFSEGDRKLMEENMKLKEMMQKLIEVGQDQLNVITNLSSRVKELEKRISKKNKKLRVRKHGGLSQSWSGSSSCSKPLSNEKVKKAVAMAM